VPAILIENEAAMLQMLNARLRTYGIGFRAKRIVSASPKTGKLSALKQLKLLVANKDDLTVALTDAQLTAEQPKAGDVLKQDPATSHVSFEFTNR
jgi:hypothetical protein